MLDKIFDLNRINNTINSFNNVVKDEYYNYLLNEFGVLFTYHSNRIEGTNKTLTLNDTKKIINNTYDFKSVIDKKKLMKQLAIKMHLNIYLKLKIKS